MNSNIDLFSANQLVKLLVVVTLLIAVTCLSIVSFISNAVSVKPPLIFTVQINILKTKTAHWEAATKTAHWEAPAPAPAPAPAQKAQMNQTITRL